MTWLIENAATIIISAILIVIISVVIIKGCKNKKRGRSCSGCSCGCKNCPMNDDYRP